MGPGAQALGHHPLLSHVHELEDGLQWNSRDSNQPCSPPGATLPWFSQALRIQPQYGHLLAVGSWENHMVKVWTRRGALGQL